MLVYIKTFGCSSNRAETAAIKELMMAAGFKLTPSLRDSDAVIVNTCTVRGETERKVLKFLSALAGKRVVVTGCMAAAQPALIARHAPNFSIVTPHNLPSIPLALRMNSRTVTLSPSNSMPEPAPYAMGAKYTIAISRGCLGNCSYCIVKLARGKLVSLPEERILSHISHAVNGGAWEIQISAQDTGVYGNDIGTNLPNLLNKIINVGGSFRVRLGMFNPSSVQAYIERLIASFEPSKVYKFIHIPVQSGSDRVLESMERRYTTSSFKEIVASFRSKYPKITLFTDIIVGYPSEADEDFEKTYEIIKSVRPDKTHIARFSPRPHTPASFMKQTPEAIKKRRSEALALLACKIQLEKNMECVGKTFEATIVDRYLHGGMIARTDEYKTVAISDCKPSMLGRRVLVNVLSCTPFYMKGEIIHH
ncbi:MAG: tRNA (N(6)-L-threonylcarbamoyladenosine(37)-C(2))-methylthiotransferase [Candidatus Methanomethylicaceae archaeon]|jgi:MiaB-like tRNA modifying enzyme